jgi:hypothetical protein
LGEDRVVNMHVVKGQLLRQRLTSFLLSPYMEYLGVRQSRFGALAIGLFLVDGVTWQIIKEPAWLFANIGMICMCIFTLCFIVTTIYYVRTSKKRREMDADHK